MALFVDKMAHTGLVNSGNPKQVEAGPRKPKLPSTRFVAFSGVDGAGKTTQIELLRQHLRNKAIHSRVYWARGGYTPGMESLKRFLRRARPNALPAPGRSKERDQRFGSARLRCAWLVLAILDLAWFWGIHMRFWRRTGRLAIADRYLGDTLLDFQLNFPADRVGDWWLWRGLEALLPKPDVHFVLIVPVEESLRRCRKKNEPFPDSAEVMTMRLAHYERMSKAAPYVRLDCLRPPDEIHAEILHRLGWC